MNPLFKIVYPNQTLEDNYEIGLVITTYNRPFYLHRTLASLRRSKLQNTVLLLIDDGSTNRLTLELLERFDLSHAPVIKAFRQEKEGCLMYENLQLGWEFLLATFNCKFLTNLDPDAIVKADWLSRLKNAHKSGMVQKEGVLITGFNAYQHPVVKETEHYYIKKSVGGINFFFDTNLYAEIIRPSLIDLQWDDHVVAAMEEKGYPIICTKPSVVQHIGRGGLWSGMQSGTFDFAIDFGDTHPFWMKVRLFYFQTSKKLGKKYSRFFLHWKPRLYKLIYFLFFSRLYLKKKKKH